MSFSYKQNGEHICGDCACFPICSKVNIKYAQKETEYCLWEKDYFYPKTLLTGKDKKLN